MLTAGNKRSRLDPVAAALVVLERDGPESLTTRAVAAEAGVTATALYRHFTDKNALLDAVIAEVYRRFKQAMLAPAAMEEAGALSWLFIAGDRYLRFALEHPNYYRLLFAEPHRIRIDRYPNDFHDGRSTGFRALRDGVARCMTAGALKEDEPADVALTIYAHMHGLIMLHFAGRFADDARVFEKFFHKSLEHLLTGLR